MKRISLVKIDTKRILIFLAILLSFFLLIPSFASDNTPNIKSNFELIESVPKDTIFGQPGVRHTQQVWLDMINTAQKTIDIGAFYFSSQPGSAMEPVINAIVKASEHGVKVRIILDGSFYKQSLPSMKTLQNKSNIEIRIIPIKYISGGVMHAKYMIVDNADVFVGSENFDSRALDQVHEIGVRVRNERLASTVLQVFNLDWKLCLTKNIVAYQYLLYKKFEHLPVTVQRPITVKFGDQLISIHPAFSPKNLVPQGLDWEQDQMISLINSARHELLMQVLQYSPAKGYGIKGYWKDLDNAIRAAAGRGVKVKMIVSNWSQKKPAIQFIKSLSLVPNVQIKISTLPPYQGKFIPFSRVEHCKYFVVDNDLSWIGTGNWEWSYFYTTRNIAMIIHGFAVNKLLQDIFNRDWNGPYVSPVDINKNYQPPKTH